MKKIRIVLICMFFLSYLPVNVAAKEFSAEVKKIFAEKTTEKVQGMLENYETNREKKEFLDALIVVFKKSKKKISSSHQRILDTYITVAKKEYTNLEQEKLFGRETTTVEKRKIAQERQAWLNIERAKYNKGSLSLDEKLMYTAQSWATKLANDYKGTTKVNTATIHQRKKNDGYYNYKNVLAWFADLGVDPMIVNGVTVSEGIGYNYMSCPKDKDTCTEKIIQEIQSTRNFFMSEKSYNGVHYRAMMQKNFTKLGVGVAYDGKRYWLVIHYATTTEKE